MRSIDPEIVAQLESGQLKPYMLLAIALDEAVGAEESMYWEDATVLEWDTGTPLAIPPGGSYAYHFTDCMVPIAMGGGLYQPRSFEVQNIRYSTGQVVDKATIRIDNLDDFFTVPFVGGDPQGASVVLSLVLLDENNQPVGGESTALFYGEIDDWTLNDGELDFGIVNAYARWPKKKASRHPSSCRWVSFKDTDCKYTGADTSCGRTYTDCAAKGNQLNFGGFRWLPSIEGKDIWWGKRP